MKTMLRTQPNCMKENVGFIIKMKSMMMCFLLWGGTYENAHDIAKHDKVDNAW